MKLTKGDLRQIIVEEIENYLNEQDDDPMDIIRKHLTDAEAEEWVAKMEKMRQEFPEEEFEAPTPLPPGEEEELRGSPEGIPGFEPDVDEDEPTGPAGTEIVPVLARTPIGRKPRRSPRTRIFNNS
jgi:hypothetical protein